MNDKPILACAPKDPKFYTMAGVTKFAPPPNSVEVPCHECGQVCFLGPRQQILMVEQDGEAWCFGCLIKLGYKAVDQVKSLGGVSGTYEMPDQN